MTKEHRQTKPTHIPLHGLLALALIVMLMAASLRPAEAACSNPAGIKADIVYNSSQKLFEYCNDMNWVRMNPRAGSGTGGCTNPSMGEGKMAYNTDHRVMQGCAGNVWRALGPFNTVFTGGQAWSVLASRWDYSCGVKLDGSLWCWGSNGNGQIGNNSTVIQVTPFHIQTTHSWKHVATGRYHTCAVRSDDTLWCWGSNLGGRSGLNTSTGNTLVPTQISGGGSWKMTSLGHDHSCGIKTDNTLWCWGTNANGRTGLNTTTGNTLVPTEVSGSGSWKSVSLGYWSTCAIKSDDTLHCWGGNSNGGTAQNTIVGNTIIPTGVMGGGSWKHISTALQNGAGQSSCGIKSDDTVWCWGSNNYGQLGDSTTTQRLIPTAISGGGSWLSVDNGQGHTCGVKSDNTAWCWGQNSDGQLNDGTTTQRTAPTPVNAGGTWRSMHTGFASTCGIRTDNQIYCWGNNSGSVMGFANPAQLASPTEISGGGLWKKVSSGFQHTCAIKNDDTAWCWGGNGNGQLGDNTTISKLSPVAVNGGGAWKVISAGGYHTCGIKSDDTAWCWGNNNYGQVGDGTTGAGYSIPTAVSGGHTWKTISVSLYDTISGHTCGIKSDDTLWCWGMNNNGRTGLNTAAGSTLIPTQVNGGGTWIALSTGASFTCGIKSAGTLWCWGYNLYFQIGDGTTVDKLIPAPVSGGGTWKQVGAELNITCGVKSDDTGWCWGGGLYSVPTAVTGGGPWKMWSGYYGIASDKSASIWNPLSGAALVPGGTAWDSISVGWAHRCGVTAAGSLLCWGSNTYGQLTQTDVSSPYVASPHQPDCGSPAGKPGAIIYNSSENILQYCMGGGWMAFGGFGAGSSPGPSDPCAGSPSPGVVCLDGSLYAGGGLYVTPADNSSGIAWNNGNNTGQTLTGVNDNNNGAANTAALIAADADSGTGGTQPHQAAQLCANLVAHGHSDWYLPSEAELQIVCSNKAVLGLNAAVIYWGSKEHTTTNAWGVHMPSCSAFNDWKHNAVFPVRCVRK